jgi:hypothetical protein
MWIDIPGKSNSDFYAWALGNVEEYPYLVSKKTPLLLDRADDETKVRVWAT